MLTELKFVQGSVAKKDFMPALTHFVIENGTVRGYNGTIALCSPIPFDIACKPKAEPLVKAINNCSDTIALSVTPAGRLGVKSGKFKTFIECVDGDTPHVLPSGQRYELDGEALVVGLKAVAPFIGEDASRVWCNGVLLRGHSMFATNNIILVEYWVGSSLPFEVNIPKPAVRELLRIGEAPTHVQMDDHSVTFHYSAGRWLRTQLLPVEWPDLARVLDTANPAGMQPVDAELYAGLRVVKPFTDKMGRVLLGERVMRTHTTEGEGAAYDLPEFPHTGVFNVEMLELLEGVAQQVDFSTYPKPCHFYGERLRGAIIGMKA